MNINLYLVYSNITQFIDEYNNKINKQDPRIEQIYSDFIENYNSLDEENAKITSAVTLIQPTKREIERDSYFDQINELCRDPELFYQQARQFLNQDLPFLKNITGCDATFAFILSIFQKSFLDSSLDGPAIEERLTNSRYSVQDLMDQLNVNRQALIEHKEENIGILYPICVPPIVQQTEQGEKGFSPHHFVIQQLPYSSNKQDVVYRIYQSYIGQYTLQNFMEKHSEFLELNHDEMLTFCKKLQVLESAETWDGLDEIEIYNDIFCASLVNIKNELPSNIDYPSFINLHFTPIPYQAKK